MSGYVAFTVMWPSVGFRLYGGLAGLMKAT